MTQISITGIFVLDRDIEEFKPDFVLSITDLDGCDQEIALDVLAKAAVPYHHMGFYDVPRLLNGCVPPNLPDMTDMMAVLDYELPVAPERIMVHCHAGVSRSPAVALIALAHLSTRAGKSSPEEGRRIARQVFEAQPMSQPNKRILDLAQQLFGEMGEAMVLEGIKLREECDYGQVDVENIW
ncbi:hypothetical protein LCGC14_0228700 [marine sediment metagenome]|jgi:predicted protein tyrosine phosphatase|uniref:Tyrosine specific protein phosphatases domain-containing protein n=1 Tax=marine sediment metagenome TaxID=412755 RepID=A0A0F9WVS9_9ZZZZ